MEKKLPVYRLTITDKNDEEEIFTALVDDPAIESNFMAFNVQKFVEPQAGESQSDFMIRCIPLMINDHGKPQEEAIAICYRYFEGHKMTNSVQFAVADSDRRIITGAVMIPDLKIYRRDEQQGEYYVYFTKEDIEMFARKWAKGNRYNAVNEMHNRNKQPSGMYLLESFISDSQRGINAPTALGDQFPEGTWFQSFYVESDEMWAKVKGGEYKGFSMEMMVDYIFNKQPDEVADLIAILDTLH